DLFVFPGGAVHPPPLLGQWCCPRAPSSESCQAALPSPSCRHALVTTALSVWRGRRRSGVDVVEMRNATTLVRVTSDGGLGPHRILELLTAKACDGKGKVWESQDSRVWQRSERCNLLGRTFNSRRDLHWPCRVRAITTRNKSGRDTIMATHRVCARAGPAARLPDLARDFSGVRFSLLHGRPIALRVWLRRDQYSPRCVCRDVAA